IEQARRQIDRCAVAIEPAAHPVELERPESIDRRAHGRDSSSTGGGSPVTAHRPGSRRPPPHHERPYPPRGHHRRAGATLIDRAAASRTISPVVSRDPRPPP